MNPLVSICMPTYNGAKYLGEALQSALQQTYRPIELVISDDQSTDRTREIIDRMIAHADFECRIYQHQPEGMVQNWNYCVKQARGHYIKFLFQDDLLTPDCVASMAALAQEDKDIGMIFSQRGIIIEEDSAADEPIKFLVKSNKDVHKGWTELRPIQTGTTLLGDPYLLHGNVNKIGEPSCVLIRRDVFSELGLFNPAFCQLVDFEFWLRIMMAYNVGFIDRELARFRIHSEQYSIHNHRNGQAADDWKNFFLWLWTDPVKQYLHPKSLRKLKKKCLRLGILTDRPKPLRYKFWDGVKGSFPSWRQSL